MNDGAFSPQINGIAIQRLHTSAAPPQTTLIIQFEDHLPRIHDAGGRLPAHRQSFTVARCAKEATLALCSVPETGGEKTRIIKVSL